MKAVIRNWKTRITSPRELIWDLQCFLEEQGFTMDEAQGLSLDATPISELATFSARLSGKRSYSQSDTGKLIMGILLCLTVLLIPLGIWIVSGSSHKVVEEAIIDIEGEIYRASATKQSASEGLANLVGTISDARITLSGFIAYFSGEKQVGEAPKVIRQEYWERLALMGERLESLMSGSAASREIQR